MVPLLSSVCPSRVVAVAVLALLAWPGRVLGQANGNGETGAVEVGEFELVGVQSVDESTLKSVLRTRKSPWLPWGDERYYDPDEFQRDLKRIVAYYKDHGFPRARVVTYDVDLNEARDEANLRVVVEEGEPVVIADVSFEGFQVIPATALDELREGMPAQPGEPIVHQEVLTTGEMAANLLRNYGYPSPTVTVREEELEDGRRSIVYMAEPGPKAVFGPIEISGNSSVSDAVIRRQLTYQPGEIYRRSVLQETHRELLSLGLFEFVTIEPQRQPEEPAIVPTRITVVEGDHRQVEFSGGFGTEERFRAEANWRHVNFYGGARTLDLHGKWSSIDRGVEASFVEPAVFHHDLALRLNGHAWYRDEPAFTALSRGGRVTLSHGLSKQSTLAFSFVNEFESSRIANEALLDPRFRDELIALGLNPTTGVQDGTLSALSVTWDYTDVDNRLDPTRGVGGSIHVEQAGSWLPGSFDYYNLLLEGRHYQPLSERLTLATRVRTGSIDAVESGGIPFFKRYFLGGSTSLRGWGRFEVGPLSGSGLPIGGQTMFEASAELRTRLFGNFGLVLFVDAGNVWRGAYEYRFDDLLYDVGPGLRYQTPVGAVRLDAAYQLTPITGLRIDGEPQDRRWRLHFSIGQAF